jgi:hypothetical protein
MALRIPAQAQEILSTRGAVAGEKKPMTRFFFQLFGCLWFSVLRPTETPVSSLTAGRFLDMSIRPREHRRIFDGTE